MEFGKWSDILWQELQRSLFSAIACGVLPTLVVLIGLSGAWHFSHPVSFHA
jgi:hypothetical protein